MKKWAATVGALALLAAPCAAQQFQGVVVGVTDGDTITVMRGSMPIKVRLFGIDCPESGQPFGKRAKQLTSALVMGKWVTVQTHGVDAYGRTLGEVVLLYGPSLSQELVRAGLAWRYRYCKDPVLGNLETQARGARLGLWADPNPIPPWEWRKLKRARRR